MPGTLLDIIKNQNTFSYKKPYKPKKFDILPNLHVATMLDQQFNEYGTDTSIDTERNNRQQQFNNYPYNIKYKFNSRGFRDDEWPDDVNDVIWCLGDSHTLGIGIPVEFQYTKILSRLTGKTVLNLGHYCATNIWLNIHALSILQEIRPKNLVIGWTNFDKTLRPDDMLTGNIHNHILFKNCIKKILDKKSSTNFIDFFTPNSVHNTISIQSRDNSLGLITYIDYARDGFHIGIKTHEWLAMEIYKKLC